MGSATLYQLAKRGIKVLGIDHLSPPHTSGSTHGDTRITRQAIGEGAHYTPLSLRSSEIFREVESKTNSVLLEQTGGLIISSAASSSTNFQSAFFENTLAAARKYGIRHEVWDAQETRNKFPQFNIGNDARGYYEYEAALLRPEAAVRAQLSLARELGASIHTNDGVSRFEETDQGVTIHTSHGTYQAQHLVLSVGPWLPEVVPELTRSKPLPLGLVSLLQQF
jgi:glycine/D-amino acid oxidase-like deaminating enzyme